MPRLTVTCATVLAVTLGCALSANAQTQLQGKTMGTQVPEPSGPAQPPKSSTRAKSDECESQGKRQGLKGHDLMWFVIKCLNKAG